MANFLRDLLGWIAIWSGYAFTFMGDFIVGNHQYFVPVCSSIGALSYAYYNLRKAHKEDKHDN